MLNAEEFNRYCDERQLAPEVRAIISRIRNSTPARRVESGRRSVACHYASRKNGHTIQAESHLNDLPYVIEKEYDPHNYEIWDQPAQIELVYLSLKGTRVHVWYTADYFEISEDYLGYIECKTEDRLEKLARQMPNRYVKNEQGGWRCPPGEQAAAKQGVNYRVRSSADINYVLYRNLQDLGSYYRPHCPKTTSEASVAILSIVTSESGITLDELLQRLKTTIATADDVRKLIVDGQMYVDLLTEPLPEPDRVHCFRDQSTAQAYIYLAKEQNQSFHRPQLVSLTPGAMINWDGRAWMIANVGESEIALLDPQNSVSTIPRPSFEALIQKGKIIGFVQPEQNSGVVEGRKFLDEASARDRVEANRRYRIIKPDLESREPTKEEKREYTSVSDRTRRRWKNAYRVAQNRYGNGYIGLIPDRSEQGGAGPVIDDEVLKLLPEFIQEHFENLKQLTVIASHRLFQDLCRKKGLRPLGYKKYTAAVKGRPIYEQTLRRQGRRAAYQHELTRFWFLGPDVPRHGDRPFHIVHIDHTQMDIELCCSRTGRNLGRPWVSFLVDSYTRRILAIYITFDPPSYRSCMMVLRICVLKWSRLPEFIVMDGGKEFESTYFETLLAMYGVSKKSRPKAEPRHGTVIENLFGITDKQFTHVLAGNTQIMKQVRQVTKSVNPKNHAVWTLERLYVRLCEYGYSVYDTNDHGTLLISPREMFALGMFESGLCEHTLIPYTVDFELDTLPTTKTGEALVQPGRGVKILNIYYDHSEFRNPSVERTKVAVRYDPMNRGVAYAYVQRRWVKLFSEHYHKFNGRSEREFELMSTELKQRQRLHGQQVEVTGAKLAAFMELLLEDEIILLQNLKDIEQKNILSIIYKDVKHADSNNLPEHSVSDNLDKSILNSQEVIKNGNIDKPEGELFIYGDL